MVPTEDEARVSDTHTSDRRARVRRVLERMRARLLAAIVHRMCINVYHRYFVPEKRQNERYFVSRVAPRVPRGCCAAFLSAPCAFFFFSKLRLLAGVCVYKTPSPQAGPQPIKRNEKYLAQRT